MALVASPPDLTRFTGCIDCGRDEPDGGRETGGRVSRGRQPVPDGRSVLDDDAVPLLSISVRPQGERAIAVDHRHVPFGEVKAVHRALLSAFAGRTCSRSDSGVAWVPEAGNENARRPGSVVRLVHSRRASQRINRALVSVTRGYALPQQPASAGGRSFSLRSRVLARRRSRHLSNQTRT